MKSSKSFNLFSTFQRIAQGAVITALMFTLSATVTGCGGGDPKPSSSVQLSGSNPTPAPAIDPLVESIADQCGIETYVGPFRGYELPNISGNVWTKGFTYSSGLGDEVISGYSEHSEAMGGLNAIDPSCLDLMRIFVAAPISDAPDELSAYSLSLDFTATVQPFPVSLAEAKQTTTLEAKLTASLKITVMKPCAHPYAQSCWENVGSPQIFPVEFRCGTSQELKRTLSASELTDRWDHDYRNAYTLDFPDQCTFRLKDMSFRTADGRLIRASIAGQASKEAGGARLRILRIAFE